MFTRMAKGVLWFMVVVLAIASLVGGIAIGSAAEDGGLGFLMILLFLAASFLVLMAFGMFVELANNVLDIKQALRGQAPMVTGMVQQNPSAQQNIPIQAYYGGGYSYIPSAPDNANNGSGYDLSKIAAQSTSQSQIQDGWYCPQCGTRNKRLARICASCGKEK